MPIVKPMGLITGQKFKTKKIFVRVKPRAKEEKVEKIDEVNFKVQVTQPPEKGKANIAVVKALADYFNVSPSNVQIISGFSSKLKIIEIIEKDKKIKKN